MSSIDVVGAADPVTTARWTRRGCEPAGAFWAIGDPGRAGREVVARAITSPPGRPDTSLERVSLTAAEICAASVRGLEHRHRDSPRQDGFSLGRVADPEAVVLTVCDGLGSLALSHEAAEHAVGSLPSIVMGHRRDDGTVDWASAIGTLSEQLHAHDRACADSDAQIMATTVVSAVVRQGVGGQHHADLVWVGDSRAYRLRSGMWERIEGDCGGQSEEEFATSRTNALPATEPAFESSSITLEPGDALFLMSDGVARPLGQGRGVVGEALAEWWQAPPDIYRFAAQVEFRRKTFVDDRTVIGLWINWHGDSPVDEDAAPAGGGEDGADRA